MLLKDLAHAARTLRKSPVFTVAAVVTIALGIGASTAVFSVTNAVLLRPLPYKNPHRLVLALADMRRRNVRDLPFSVADFLDLRNGAKTMFEDFAAIDTFRAIVPREDGTPEQVRFAEVTPNFFRLLGTRIAFGRDFEDADGQPEPPRAEAGGALRAQSPPRLPTMAILSYEYFERHYGGDTSVLGKLRGGGATEIVGVLAPGAELLLPPKLNVERVPEIWVAARLAYDTRQRNNYTRWVVGRLKGGVSLGQAQTEADLVAAELRKSFLVEGTSDWHIRLEPMQEHLTAEVRPAILALMGAVIFLLLIACTNVANLLLVRASLRERELAVRSALGGSRWRLMRQMLAEALLLAGLGTLLGLGLARFGTHELLVIAPANLPRLESIAIDPVVLAFTALAGLAATAVFGITPAWRASRPDVTQVLRANGRSSGLARGRILRNGAVIAEIALSFVLLIGSGLMFRSFLALQRTNPGYEANGVLTFNLFGVFEGRPKPEQRAALMREIQDRLRLLPGVESVTASSPFPLAGGFYPIRWVVGRQNSITLGNQRVRRHDWDLDKPV